MVDDDLCGEGTADRPVRVSFLQSILDALDVGHAAVVEGGAEGHHQQLVLADVVLVAGVILGSIAGVAAEVIGVGVLAFHHFLLLIGQGVPCSLCGLALGVGVIAALLHIDGVDQVCHILCSCFVCVLAGGFAAGSGGACCAGSSAGGCAAAAGEHTGAQGQSRHSSGQLFGLEFSHECFSFPAKKYSALKQKGTGKKS